MLGYNYRKILILTHDKSTRRLFDVVLKIVNEHNILGTQYSPGISRIHIEGIEINIRSFQSVHSVRGCRSNAILLDCSVNETELYWIKSILSGEKPILTNIEHLDDVIKGLYDRTNNIN